MAHGITWTAKKVAIGARESERRRAVVEAIHAPPMGVGATKHPLQSSGRLKKLSVAVPWPVRSAALLGPLYWMWSVLSM